MFRKKIRFLVLLNLYLTITALPHFVHKRQVPDDLCKIIIGDVTLDLKYLKNAKGYEIKYGDKRFLFNICGTVPECQSEENNDVSSCLIDDKSKNVTILGLYNEHSVSTLMSYNPPALSYRYLNGNKKKTTTVIEFKCNRFLKKNITYLVPAGQVGREFKFLFETDFVCIKRPINCQVKDIENYMYDLQPLFSKIDYRILSNLSTIFLNICGNLTSDFDDDCSYNGTQICQLDKNGNYKNLGIFSSGLQPYDDKISIIFTDGSSCLGGHISTQIDFKCSSANEKPVLISSSSCRYNILWKTVYACPDFIEVYHKCQINTNVHFEQQRSLKQAFSKLPIVNGLLNINICGSLQCNGYNNVSICVEKNGKELIYGWKNETIISKNGNLKMELHGEGCNKVKINFKCAFSKEKQGKINIKEDNCEMKIEFYTKLACPNTEVRTENCVFKSDDDIFDLRPLVLFDENYEFTKNNVIYSINLCRPIVHSEKTGCDSYSAICSYNTTEPDLRKRFVSLGRIPEKDIKFTIKNNQLNLIFEDGNLCRGLESHSTLIRFVCVAQNETLEPVLISKTICKIEFEWKTPYGCPNYYKNETENFETRELSTEKSVTTEKQIDNAQTEKPNQSFTEKSVRTSTEEIVHTSEKSVHSSTENIVHMSEISVHSSTENIVHTSEKPIVSSTEDSVHLLTENSTENSVSNEKTTIKTKVTTKHTTKKPKTYKATLPYPIVKEKESIIRNCSLIEEVLQKKINLTHLPHNIKVESVIGKKYSINICDNGNVCNSPICGGKNFQVPFGSAQKIFFNVDKSQDFVELNFLGQNPCEDGFYSSSLFLKCSEKMQKPTVVNEDKCSVHFEWYNNSTCALLGIHQENDIKNIIIITVFTVFISVIIIIAVLFYLRKKHNYRKVKDEYETIYLKNVKD